MILINKTIDALNITITFYIGKSASDNFDLIDTTMELNPENIWFHVEDKPSCHVVADIPLDLILDKKDLMYIVKQGALLCKQCSKYKSESNLSIVWTKIKNVHKTRVLGSVATLDTKCISV